MTDMPTDAHHKVNVRECNTRWSLRTKIKRGLWNCAWIFLFGPTPKRMGNPWWLWLLRRFGTVVHSSTLVHQTYRILQPRQLEIRDGSAVGGQVEIDNYARVGIGIINALSGQVFESAESARSPDDRGPRHRGG